MSKKTMTTVLVVLLVIAAAVAVYFLTRPAQTPPPVPEVTLAPVAETEVPAAETEAPAAETEAPAAETEAPAAKIEAPAAEATPETVAAAVETAADKVEETAAAVVETAKDTAAEAAAAVETAADKVEETAIVAVETAKETAAEAAAAVDTAKDKVAEVAAAVVETAKETAAEAAAAVDTAKDKVEETAAAVVETAKETAAEAAAAVETAADKVEETAKAAVDTATDKVEETATAAVETAKEMAAEAAAVAKGGAKTKVAIWHTFTEGQEAYLKKAVDDFNASREDVQVELLSQPYSGFTNTVYSAVVEGIGPDIIFNYASEAANYVKAGQVADLSQYIYDPEIGIEGFDEALKPGVLEGEVLGFEDGLIHYVPAYTTGPILYYNKTLLDELKLSVPTTWEEMEQAAKAIFDAKGIPAMGVDNPVDLLQMLIMETPGAGYIDVKNQQVLFDTPEIKEKVQWVVDMVKKGYFRLQPSGDYFSVDFSSGIIATYMGSSAGYPYISPDGFEFGMSALPAKTWYPSWNRGPIVFYYKDDARAQAAYEFVKYFISPEVNAGWVESVTALAPYAWTQDVPAYQAFVAKDDLAGHALKAVEQNLDKAGSLPAVTGATAVRNAIRDAVMKAAGGEMSVDAAWTECVTISNAALKGQ